jgi:DNA invertase Pin-like site-specific DNA recombinase
LKAALDHARKCRCPLVAARLSLLGNSARRISEVMLDRVPVIIAADGFEMRPLPTELTSARTKAAMMRARRRGIKPGGWNEESEAEQRRADQFAKSLRSTMERLAYMSAYAAAAELNRLGVKTALGTRWHDGTVRRLRARLARLAKISRPRRKRVPRGMPRPQGQWQ